ncbi:hypothetical protein [Amycolatopsis granulosa]|uniref:hypothetical protein n=1 Tax=Amycolatopsis granulosa TaxID=185684 RepID=UPI00142019AE|nr:hypothetical protein [Amycolatopsis granulosa]NIH86315.1 hypothetical protein [Amycolatopsis granulosa]
MVPATRRRLALDGHLARKRLQPLRRDHTFARPSTPSTSDGSRAGFALGAGIEFSPPGATTSKAVPAFFSG